MRLRRCSDLFSMASSRSWRPARKKTGRLRPYGRCCQGFGTWKSRSSHNCESLPCVSSRNEGRA